MAKKRAPQSTIFDDVYRTMAQKLPTLFLPLINEMFGCDYPLSISSEQLRNEHFSRGKKRITDSLFRLADTTYHIECQSTEDGTMLLRMFEYDFQIALEAAQDTPDEIRFPYAGVVYLRGAGGRKRPRPLKVTFPDEQSLSYQPRQLYVAKYSLKELFDKNLLLLLPYYMLRYEKQLKSIGSNAGKTVRFLAEYQELAARLQQKLPPEEHAAAYLSMTQLIKRISHYLLRDQSTLKEGVDHIMGGRIIPLYSERIEARGRAEGEARGRAEGEARGRAEGEARGRAEGEARERLSSIRNVMQSLGISAAKAMDILRIPAGERDQLLAAL